MQQHTHLSAAAYVLANLPADPSVYRSQPDEDFDRNLETIMTLEEAEGKPRGELLAGGTFAGLDEPNAGAGKSVTKSHEIREGFKITDMHGGKGVICRVVPDDEGESLTADPEDRQVAEVMVIGAIAGSLSKKPASLEEFQKIGRPLRPMPNLPEYEYLSPAELADPYFHRRQLLAQREKDYPSNGVLGQYFKRFHQTMPTPKDVPITSSKQLFDDCPSVKDKWMRSPIELIADHLQVLADATQADSYDTHELTDYARENCGDLLDKLNAHLRVGKDIDWDQGDYLTGKGFPVTYDKATDVLCVSINNSAIFVGRIPEKKASVLK